MKTLYSVLLAAIFFVLIFSNGGLVYTQEENATSTSEPRFLSIQHARSGSIFENNTSSMINHLLKVEGPNRLRERVVFDVPALDIF